MTREIAVETTIHGRVLLQDAADSFSAGLLVAFHGYGQSADEMLAAVVEIPGAARWRIASVQGLHRFYQRRDEKVVASWMTRQDREQAIADNLAYVDRAIAECAVDVRASAVGVPASAPVVVIGFSQGTAMAYRTALLGRHRIAGLIALGGDIPPDVRTASVDRAWPAVLIGVGDEDFWYTREKVASDEAFLDSRRVPCQIERFQGGHEWTDAFRATAGRWLSRMAP